MRHGYGAALLDLPPEQRDDAAVAAEDIAEAHGHELRFGALAMVCTIISQTRLLAPMTFVGFTALSVEMSTKVSVP